jgi:translation initiation factor IF-2
MRDGQELFDGRLESLKRFQEDVSEVKTGFECGIGVAGFDDFVEGDVFEFYREERVA